MIALFALALLQQAPLRQSSTTPPSGDTTGYWQQHVSYTVVATLDETQTKLKARAMLVYVNHSPDTLTEMYFHQYLNAFRPGSKWSELDEREHRVRFQNLADPDYGYERFTAPPVVDGTPVVVDYPGAPDSTVAHFRLARPLAPGDSARIAVEWEARPSTVPRRQARRGRTWDFAQWYPKVAVYDRGGWQPNPLIPAGELYGEFGTYDVTLIVRDDQVLASTGVPVSGDPGWARVSRTGAPYLASNAYARVPVVPTEEAIADGYRPVRFFAENVHHFAWSASPDYRYEGGVHVRTAQPARFQTWDTVGVHVLFKPGDDTTWGGGRAVERTLVAARWLESIWGPYAYPQITNVHRIDGGGTEFPMMIMDGSASQGLILHELGHVFTYGILANNEWRSGWLDEGLTDYQTDWAQRLTRPERIAAPPEPPLLAPGYRVNARTIPPADRAPLALWLNEVRNQSEPIGTAAYDFREFGVYNTMVYDRAKLMYSQLRDVMGDSAFLRFFHDYYGRWALKHVDELAMRTAAERAYGGSLGWFFAQWVHGTGLMDYALDGVRVNTDGSRFETIARIRQRGELRHPIPVGVLTASGWAFGRADPTKGDQDVHIITTGRPLRVEIDPSHVTWDWDWRNNIQSGLLLGIREPEVAFNWPYLDQADRSHTMVALSPAAWYSNPQGPIVGVRAKTSYLTHIDRADAGFAFSSRNPRNANGDGPTFGTRFQGWVRAENLYLPWASRPLMGYGGGVNYVDGIFKADLFRNWDLSPLVMAQGSEITTKVYATTAIPSSLLLLPEQWAKTNIAEVGTSGAFRTVVDVDSSYFLARGSLGLGYSSGNSDDVSRGYVRIQGALGAVRPIGTTASQLRLRLFGGIAKGAPRQRAIFASSQDPFETFTNDLFRGRGALLKQDGVNFLPLGGAGMRGYNYNVAVSDLLAANGEFLQQIGTSHGQWGWATVSVSAFGDIGVSPSRGFDVTNERFADAGVSLWLRGRFYDRNLSVRLDAPLFVNQSGFAAGKLSNRKGSFASRLSLSVGDLW